MPGHAHTAGSRSIIVTGLLATTPLGAAPLTWAVPSFARQTGAACEVCHTAFPELTHFGGKQPERPPKP